MNQKKWKLKKIATMRSDFIRAIND